MGYRSDFKKNLKTIFGYKWVKYAFLLNFIYFLIGIAYFYLSQQNTEQFGNDFNVFFHAGMLAKNDIKNLYNPSEYTFPFRYLPLTAYVFWFVFGGFTGLDVTICYIPFAIANFLINIPIVVMIYHIIFGAFKIDKKVHEKRVLQYIAMYLAFGPHIDNYVNGQVNSFVAFFLLTSLYFFEYPNYRGRDPNDKPVDHYDLYGGLCLGLAILTKVTAIILIPFVLVVRIKIKPPRIQEDMMPKYEQKSARINFLNKLIISAPLSANFARLLFPALVLLMNCFIFWVNPGMWTQFNTVNFSGSGEQVWKHSFSLVRIILNLNELIMGNPSSASFSFKIFLSVFIPIFAIVFWSYARNMHAQRILPMYYSLALLTLLIGYYDSWAHHLIVILPFLIISIVQIKDAVSDNTGNPVQDLPQPEDPNYVPSTECLRNVSYKDYKIIRMAFIASGLYFWTLFFFFMEDVLHIVPGLNIFYTIIILTIYVSLLVILNRRDQIESKKESNTKT